MNAKTREQVVELLRCAADNASGLDASFGFAVTAAWCGATPNVRQQACDAFVAVSGERGKDWVAACLEAALVVEHGWTP